MVKEAIKLKRMSYPKRNVPKINISTWYDTKTTCKLHMIYYASKVLLTICVCK